MKKIIYMICISILVLQSCSSDSNNNGSNNNNVSSPFTVRYELRTTSNVHSSWGAPMVTYVNSTGQQQTESVPSLSSTNPWIKTITVTSTTRPLQLNLLLSTQPANVYRLWLSNVGSITQNIYVNDVLVASSINQSTTTPYVSSTGNEYNIELVQLGYSIN
jgi:hypothetical protein